MPDTSTFVIEIPEASIDVIDNMLAKRASEIIRMWSNTNSELTKIRQILERMDIAQNGDVLEVEEQIINNMKRDNENSKKSD